MYIVHQHFFITTAFFRIIFLFAQEHGLHYDHKIIFSSNKHIFTNTTIIVTKYRSRVKRPICYTISHNEMSDISVLISQVIYIQRELFLLSVLNSLHYTCFLHYIYKIYVSYLMIFLNVCRLCHILSYRLYYLRIVVLYIFHASKCHYGMSLFHMKDKYFLNSENNIPCKNYTEISFNSTFESKINTFSIYHVKKYTREFEQVSLLSPRN